ncbi:MAG: hypothetical protein ACJAZ8_002265 [Planctomycetota bacterium]|jgi:hypothetical protein
MLIKNLAPLPIAIVASFCATTLISETPPVLATETAAITRALDDIDADEIKADIFFIASDAMGGRDTVSAEQRIAARFIKARLAYLGFTPGNGDKFLYEYPLEQKSLDRDSLTANIGGTTPLVYGTDYCMPDSFGVGDLSTDAGVVYCGEGGSKDFGSEELAGKWALVDWDDQNLYRLRSRARKADAVGVLIAPAPEFEGTSIMESFSGKDAGSFTGRVSYPSSANGSSKRSVFPMLILTKEARTSLVASSELALGMSIDSTFAETRTIEGGGLVMAENVCGFWPGSDPELKNEVLIVSAHYDHVGTRDGVVYNGADDNGSGTTGLLAIASALKEYGPMRRSVMLIWVSGEEKGLWGSKAWASNPSLPEGARAVANINIDMIGRNASNVLYLTPSPDHKDFGGLTLLGEKFGIEEGFGDFPKGREQGLEGLGSADPYYQRSDHAEFAKMGIPVCFFFAGEHEDYHQPGDTPDKIDYDKISRVSRTVVKMLDAMQTDTLDL